MKQLSIGILLIASVALTACAKKDNTTENTTEASVPVVEEQISPEQQAAINAIDKPILDEKNTDVPAEVANMPAGKATSETTDAESSAAAAK